MFRRIIFPNRRLIAAATTSIRHASSTTSSSIESLETKIENLQATVSKQQVALAGLAKKVVSISNVTVTSTSASEQTSSASKAEIENLSTSISEMQTSIFNLENRINSMEQEIKNLVKNNSKSSSTSTTSGNDRLLSELVSRISAIESKQAIIKISQKHQRFDDEKRISKNHQQGEETLLVTMEPGIDGTPRLLTCQVKVVHPTAMVTDIRSLMETVGPVVSCLRKPGESGKNNNNNNSNSSKPCFVVTFQNTIDAARAMENVSGIMIRGVPVQVESYIQPEQMLS